MNKVLGLIFLLLTVSSIKLEAQSPPDSLGEGALYNLSSPYQSISRHLYYLQNDSYDPEKAADVIGGDLDKEERIKSAIQLLEIYNAKGDYINLDLVPDESDYIDTLNNLPRYYILPKKYPQIYLEKYEGEWLYSVNTIRNLPAIYQSTIPSAAQTFKSIVPEIGERSFLGLKIWKWIGFLIIAGLSVLLYMIMDRSFNWGIRKIIPRIFSSDILNLDRVPPAAHVFGYLLISILLRNFFMPMLILPISVSRPLYIILSILISVFGILFLFRIIDILADIFDSLAERTSTTMDNQLVPLISRIAKMLVAVFGIIFILDNLEINVTALLAGVSIGGLALALAAQDTVRNFIGSITIFIDRPFTIGDFIEVGGVSGTVKEVGVRSTRITASDGALISMPNGDLANKTILNHSLRDYRRYSTAITVSYNTLPDTLAEFVNGVREIVMKHPKVRKNSVGVQFHEMSASSLDIFYAAIFEETNYTAWLEARQEIFLDIMKLAEDMKVGFAFPSTSIYVESLPKQEE
ncbi:MAG: mechanosensitive ion channel family protein [Bacteroidota bacterium]